MQTRIRTSTASLLSAPSRATLPQVQPASPAKHIEHSETTKFLRGCRRRRCKTSHGTTHIKTQFPVNHSAHKGLAAFVVARSKHSRCTPGLLGEEFPHFSESRRRGLSHRHAHREAHSLKPFFRERLLVAQSGGMVAAMPDGPFASGEHQGHLPPAIAAEIFQAAPPSNGLYAHVFTPSPGTYARPTFRARSERNRFA